MPVRKTTVPVVRPAAAKPVEDETPATVRKAIPKKRVAKKAPVKKSPVRKASTKTASAKKSAAKKPAKKASVIADDECLDGDSLPQRRVTPAVLDAVVLEDDETAQDAMAFARGRHGAKLSNHRRSALERLDDPPPAPLPTLLNRVSRAIERELTQIELIVGGTRVLPRHRTEAERRARTLASLARTLREVMQLRESEEKCEEDDDALPRDIDELRAKLAQRLDELVADAKAVHPGAAQPR